MMPLVENTIKISLVLLLGMTAAWLMRRRSAAVRHWILATTLGCAAIIPLVGAMAPVWSLGILARPPAPVVGPADPATATAASIDVAVSEVAASPVLPSSTRLGGLTLGRILLAVWIAGVIAHLVALSVGLVRLNHLAAAAERVDDAPWAIATADLSRGYGLRSPIRLLRGRHPSLLITWGAFSPAVMVPPSSAGWSAERIRIVLAHELAHVARGDWPIQIGAEFLRAVYWFNPLVWLACRRLRQESEHACDDAVVELGVEAREYATHLLDLARALASHRRRWVPAAAMTARPSVLQLRIKAMLNSRLDRHPLSRVARAAVGLALLAITIPIAGFAQGRFVTVSGSIADQTSAVLPGVTVVLKDEQRQAKHEVKSDGTGHFEFLGIPGGEYVIEANLPGFATRPEKLSVAGDDVRRDLQLQIGSLMETVTVKGGVDATEPSSASAPASVGARRSLAGCTAPTSIGGQIRAPQRIRDVRPQYPQQLNDANVKGVVILGGVIGTNGSFRTLEVLRTPHPDLATAALNAVSQWEFDETLLNCVPVETRMTVVINFAK